MDKMMTLPPELQEEIKTRVRQYEAEREMPFLSTMEEMAIAKGREEGIAIGEERGIAIGEERKEKLTNKKSIINLLQKRFGFLPESLIESINKIEDISVLENLLLETVSVSSPEEFEELIKENLSE